MRKNADLFPIKMPRDLRELFVYAVVIMERLCESDSSQRHRDLVSIRSDPLLYRPSSEALLETQSTVTQFKPAAQHDMRCVDIKYS